MGQTTPRTYCDMCCGSSNITPNYGLTQFLLGTQPIEGKRRANRNGDVLIENDEIRHKLRPILRELEQEYALYSDPYFASIEQTTGRNEHGETYKWGRIYNVIQGNTLVDIKKPLKFFMKNPDLGYFFVFLTFLSKNPELIKAQILQDLNHLGLFVVKAFVKGQPSQILIDNKILLDSSGQPAFIGTDQDQPQQLWVYVYEKAWMKIKAGLSNMFNLQPQESFWQLLNIPVKRVMLNYVIPETLESYLAQNPKSYFYYFKLSSNPKPPFDLRQNQYYPLVSIGYNNITRQHLFLFGDCNDINGVFQLNLQQIYQQFQYCTTVFYYRRFVHTTIPFSFQHSHQQYIKFKMAKSGVVCIVATREKGFPQQFAIDLLRIENKTGKVVNIKKATRLDRTPNKCLSNQYVYEGVFEFLTQGHYILWLRIMTKHRQLPKDGFSTVTFYTQQDLTDYVDANHDMEARMLHRCRALYEEQKQLGTRCGFRMVDEFPGKFVIYLRNMTENQGGPSIRISHTNANLECQSHKATFDKEGSKYSVDRFNLQNQAMVVFEKRGFLAGTSIGHIDICQEFE